MELLDICDENGIPTGEVVPRNIAHRDGILHRTAHVWIVRGKDSGYDVLLQKRSMEKESFPGFYDTSSAGHIPSGEEPVPSALRELKEELGITAKAEELLFAGKFRIKYEKVFHGSLFRDNEVTFVYVYRGSVDTAHLVLQKSEVDDVRWFDLEEVWQEIQTDRSRFCVPSGGLEILREYLETHPEMRRPERRTGNLCECHGHLMMDGADYKNARQRHLGHVDMEYVRGELEALKAAGVTYFRDGGDACMVSAECRALPAEYGIEYVTPIFAIHKKGLYGGIVGREFADMDEYRKRIGEVRAERGDFVKLIVSGIITFHEYGELSCSSLSGEEIHEMIRIAHEAGYPVMVHVNGDRAVRDCIDAGADSIEHAYFQKEETLEALARSKTVWVPTLAAIDAFIGRDGFNEEIARKTLTEQMRAVRAAAHLGATLACGSDSGAVGVPHGAGTVREMELLKEAGLAEEAIEEGNRRIRETFRGYCSIWFRL